MACANSGCVDSGSVELKMTPFAAIGMLSLAVLSYRMARSIFYPPFLFSAWWTVQLLNAYLCQDRFGSLSEAALVIYVLGALAFTLGGLTAMGRRMTVPPQDSPRDARTMVSAPYIRQVLVIGACVLGAVWPLYWKYLSGLASATRSSDLWWAMRSATIARGEVAGTKSIVEFTYDNMALAAIFFALTAAAHYGRDRVRGWHVAAATLVGVSYNLATASRSGAVLTIVGVISIIAFKRRSVKFVHIVVLVVGFGLVYSSMAVLLQKGGDMNASISRNLESLWNSVLLYDAGPVVAFSNYLAQPTTIATTWGPVRSLLQLGDRLGLDVGSIPSLHTGYTLLDSGDLINVYTMYFSYYPDFGVSGVFVCTFIVGGLSAAAYHGAIQNRPGCLLLYGVVVFECIMSSFNEGFFLGLNMWLKALLYIVALYYALPWVLRACLKGRGPTSRRMQLAREESMRRTLYGSSAAGIVVLK